LPWQSHRRSSTRAEAGHVETTRSTMVLRQIVSRSILPSLGKDLNHSIGQELSSMENIMGPMIAPRVFSYQQELGPRSGAFTTSTHREAPAAMETKLVLVEQPVKTVGLFCE